jgi:hypothetical protein
MQPMTPEEILQAFDPADREQLALPDLSQVAWEDLDYFGWHDPGASRAYLVTHLPERPVGLVMKAYSSPRQGFCDLCFSVDKEAGARAVMVETWKNPRTNFGIMVCANLDCSASARDKKWVYRMEETISTGRRIERLQQNVDRFVRSVTGIGL